MFDGIKDTISSKFSGSDDEESDSQESGETEGTANGSISKGQKAKSLLKGKRVLDEDELESHLDDFEMTLLQNNVAMDVADEITTQVKEELKGEKQTIGRSSAPQVREALRNAVKNVLSYGQDHERFMGKVKNSEKPFVIVFTGVNGVGKTTTIARLAHLLEEEGFSSVLANGDTYRAGAEKQIQDHSDQLGKKLISHEQGGDPAAVLYDAVEYAEANDIDVVLCDTAGRLHTSEGLMEQLSKINRVVDPDEVVFVDEATAGQDAINRAEEFDEAASIDGAILTKADADESGGAVLSIPYVLEKPVYYLGVGQSYDDLEEFDPETIAERLVES